MTAETSRIVSLGDFTFREQTRLEKLLGPEWARLIKGILTNPLSVTGLVILSLIILTAVFAPLLAPMNQRWEKTKIPRDGFLADPHPPGSEWKKNTPEVIPFWYKPLTGNDKWVHLWGTTASQYDIYYGVIWGTRTALFVGLVIAISSAVIGIFVGSVAGFYGGWIDEVLMRFVEIFNAFPFLVAALILASVLVPKVGEGVLPASIALVVFGWTGYARLLRGDILATKERDYVLAAYASGAKDFHLILRHVLPNAIFPTLVVVSLNMGAIVLNFAALGFLGIGLPVGYADWGQIISFARSHILTLDQDWYVIIYPGVALLLYGLSWNLVGDALRDILDPKLRQKGS